MLNNNKTGIQNVRSKAIGEKNSELSHLVSTQVRNLGVILDSGLTFRAT